AAEVAPVTTGARLPREGSRPSTEYLIEPSDVLVVKVDKLIPKPTYKLSPHDVLKVYVLELGRGMATGEEYTIGPDGTIPLGGPLRVSGLTVEEAKRALEKHLSRDYKDPTVGIGVVNALAAQQTRGEHLVRPDGTICPLIDPFTGQPGDVFV